MNDVILFLKTLKRQKKRLIKPDFLKAQSTTDVGNAFKLIS